MTYDANNQFCGVFNSGSNDVIKVFDNGWYNGEKIFLHDTTGSIINPAGFGNSGGSGPGGTAAADFQNKLPQVRTASGILHDWNYANRNHTPSQGFLSYHYLSKGDSAVGFSESDSDITNGSFGGLSTFGTYKSGPEILNGGKVSISTGDHIMIKINENTIEYYKNGTIVSSETQTGTNGSRIGGVTNFRRLLTLGGSSNTGSFTIKRFNWHGNLKSASEANTIYLDRDFVYGGSGSTLYTPQCKAKGSYSRSAGSSGTGILSAEYNVSGISDVSSSFNNSGYWGISGVHTSVILFRVTFSTALANSDFQVLITEEGSNRIMTESVHSKSTSGFEILVIVNEPSATSNTSWGIDFVAF